MPFFFYIIMVQMKKNPLMMRRALKFYSVYTPDNTKSDMS